MTAFVAAREIAAGLQDSLGDRATVRCLPIADGGEGTLDALCEALGAEEITVSTVDALGRPRAARFGMLPDGRALIEAAEANGLPLVDDVDLRPLDASSYGVGVLARAALERGASEILLTVGGSASTDGGAGLLRALGARWFDATGHDLPDGGGALARLSQLDLTGLLPRAGGAVAHRVRCRQSARRPARSGTRIRAPEGRGYRGR